VNLTSLPIQTLQVGARQPYPVRPIQLPCSPSIGALFAFFAIGKPWSTMHSVGVTAK
jgi:hypothetical protein